MSRPWARATIHEHNYGCICECGAMKTDQALTCADCAADRRKSPDHWERRTCSECGGPKDRRAKRCRLCENAARLGDPRWYFGVAA